MSKCILCKKSKCHCSPIAELTRFKKELLEIAKKMQEYIDLYKKNR